ncbi:MAG: MFS transporter [Firmicutes bacterium]|nr:MFS transporter [Bacillota bacterium]
MKNFTKEERSWIFYDWANSVFATIMVAAVFPTFFVGIAGGEDTPGSMWWAIGIVVARVTVGLAAPFIGALIDYKGYKKRMFIVFLACGGIFTLFTAFVSEWQMLLLGYILANIFYSVCNQIYDSFLPDVTTNDRMDVVSAAGFGYGYIGGSTIPFIISIILILFGENVGIDAVLAVRLSVILTAVWWMIFSIPIIKNVHHKYGKDKPEKGLFVESFKAIISTAKKIIANKPVFAFIIAYFFYIDGVGTVINMATAYGAELGLGTTGMIGALFVTQVVAFPFSLLFGKLSRRTNPVNLITAAIVIYFCICVVGFIMGFGLEENFFGVETATVLFWILAFMVGTVQGGIQAISRSTYSRLIPAEQSGEYFGFFEIFGRFSAILGPALYAIMLNVTGRASFSILSVVAVFLVGLIILSSARKSLIAQFNA